MMTPDEDISADVTHRHFKAIRTAWKYPRSEPERPGALHQLDEELAGWMKCFAGGAELRGGPATEWPPGVACTGVFALDFPTGLTFLPTSVCHVT